jgi:hypothetical protein
LPMLGALPADGVPGSVIQWVPLLVIGAGAVAGWWLHRQIEIGSRGDRSGLEPFLVSLGAAVVAGTAAGLLTVLAAGSAGPGRLAVVGGPAGPVALAVAGLCLVGLLGAAVPTDPVVRERFMSGCRTVGAMLRSGGGTAWGDRGGSEVGDASPADLSPRAGA